MSDTTLQLGDFTFAGFEIPESIEFGGEQMLRVHKMVGGGRQIDAMGRDDVPLEWSGRLQGANALDRATTLNAMRVDGKPLTLTWSGLSFRVVIKKFVARFERSYQLPYQIACEVIEDLTRPAAPASDQVVDDMMTDDLNTATDFSDQIDDPDLTTLMDTLSTVMSQVQSFVLATSAQIAEVLTAVEDARARALDLRTLADNAMAVSDTLGGVVVGDAAGSALSLVSTNESCLEAALTYDMDGVLGRMQINLSAIGASGTEITVAGGSLYQIATDAYGDPTAWAAIAKVNGLVDPVLTGLQNIRIPPTAPDTGGLVTS